MSRAAISAAKRWPRLIARVNRPDAVPWLVIVPMPLGRRHSDSDTSSGDKDARPLHRALLRDLPRGRTLAIWARSPR
jgi:hypothetical protein